MKKSNKTNKDTHLNYCPHTMKMMGSLKQFTNILKDVYNNYMLHLITCSMPASVSSWHTEKWQVFQKRHNNLRVMQENLVCSTFTDNLNHSVLVYSEKGGCNLLKAICNTIFCNEVIICAIFKSQICKYLFIHVPISFCINPFMSHIRYSRYSEMLKMPNVRLRWQRLMVFLMQLSFKFWSSVAPKRYCFPSAKGFPWWPYRW